MGLRTSTFLSWFLSLFCAPAGRLTTSAINSAVVVERSICTPPDEVASDVGVFGVRANINQGKTRAASRGFDGHNVLIVAGADFQFEVVSGIALAGEFIGLVVPA